MDGKLTLVIPCFNAFPWRVDLAPPLAKEGPRRIVSNVWPHIIRTAQQMDTHTFTRKSLLRNPANGSSASCLLPAQRKHGRSSGVTTIFLSLSFSRVLWTHPMSLEAQAGMAYSSSFQSRSMGQSSLPHCGCLKPAKLLSTLGKRGFQSYHVSICFLTLLRSSVRPRRLPSSSWAKRNISRANKRIWYTPERLQWQVHVLRSRRSGWEPSLGAVGMPCN